MDGDLKSVFTEIIKENRWGDPDSVSGKGSNLGQTVIIREALPKLMIRYNIKTMLDAPCGDFFWMKEIIQKITRNTHYTGADIVIDLVQANIEKHDSVMVKFKQLDLANDWLAKYDLIFTRDCFIHLSYWNIYRILKNYKKSGSVYLLVSTYPDERRVNYEIKRKFDFRPLNLQKFPFLFPKPLELINEGCTEDNGIYSDKSLGLWELSKINTFKLGINIVTHSLKIKIKMFLKTILNRFWQKNKSN